MSKLKVWLEDPLNTRLAEPNSSLGKAFQYLLNHWETLTQFLRVPGAAPQQQHRGTGLEAHDPPAP